ncbi:MAG: endonuclease/exonuclease/phosphatase family protein [Myxococcales bacterium]|nr:endonuclease/exonuclease/phosphatase family protein [Myxococcales bacterium]HQY62869.1 endonuclease/exonuclease/phosphatase family protein [Polyangiaceae bacterium]
MRLLLGRRGHGVLHDRGEGAGLPLSHARARFGASAWRAGLAALTLGALGPCVLGACRDDSGPVEAPPLPPLADAGPDVRPDTRPEPPRGPTIEVASFNVHRLFDTVCDTGDCGPGAYEEEPSPAALAAKAAELGAAIRALRAGVVLLQEVESQASLRALTEAVPELPSAVLGETGGAASVDVAVLSAYPITKVRSHYATPLTLPDGRTTTFSRDLLEVHLQPPSPFSELIVLVAHFRSKVNDDPERRLAEARAARAITVSVAQTFPTATVVLGGDLNDVPGSPALEALAAGGELVRVSEGLAQAEIGTVRYGGVWVALDHLFLARQAVGRLVPGTFQVFRGEQAGWGGSDHGAIRATFTP